ncbi:MAG: UbiD family decarboxylase [Acidimicrobiia bacterium]
MPDRDLAWFIEELRRRGLLNDIRRPVDLVEELGAVLNASERSGRAALFHSVEGHSMPVLGGALSSHAHMAAALECEVGELGDRIRSALAEPIPPQIVEGPVPCQEVVDKEADLGSLPIPVHAPGDGGQFINAGVVVAREPGGGRHNLSYIRMQVKGSDRTGFNINPWRHLGEFLDHAEERGENLPFCVAIGVDPAVMMAAAFRYPGDEYEIAGALRGEPIPVVKATTCDILVPASAEIILEGELLAGVRETEGPMAEFTGHYSGVHDQPVAVIHAITHRKQPVFQTIAGASLEHLVLGNAVVREPPLRSAVERITDRATAFHVPPYGSGFAALVSLERPRPGEARNVGLAALHSHINVKTVIVVDSDVNIFDPVDVLWSLAIRVRWGTDIIVIRGSGGNNLDPSADSQGVVDKIIIDATLDPAQRQRYSKVRYPRINLADYVSTE